LRQATPTIYSNPFPRSHARPVLSTGPICHIRLDAYRLVCESAVIGGHARWQLQISITLRKAAPLARVHCVAAAGRVCPVGGQDSRGASRTLLHYSLPAGCTAGSCAGSRLPPLSQQPQRKPSAACGWPSAGGLRRRSGHDRPPPCVAVASGSCLTRPKAPPLAEL